MVEANRKHSLLYVADPLCPWSYGFAPVFQRIREKYSNSIEFSLVLGGTQFGADAETFSDELVEKLRYSWKEVERITGRSFNYETLKRRDLRYDSEPACKAIISIQRLRPEVTFDFLDAISLEFHAKGADPSEQKTFATLSESFGVPTDEFQEMYARPETSLETLNDFQYGFSLGVTSFPALVFSDGFERGILSRGYLPFSEVDSMLGDYFRSIGKF
ncbi:protein-disulfide isomerase [Leptospira perolatii]|uniref:Protein-disulfide isomerase n=1 Tax=Leptospira perolatii TaxID=2023191 RepID=A0A2M9ZKQ6_9LEPT|nr:protein-disulfide isomerase [Leptospira perolatii]PJZ72571.1 protein-disulfide isomerase [Leptospira perolatii]